MTSEDTMLLRAIAKTLGAKVDPPEVDHAEEIAKVIYREYCRQSHEAFETSHVTVEWNVLSSKRQRSYINHAKAVIRYLEDNGIDFKDNS